MDDGYLDDVVGVVEADSYASHMLWLEHALDAAKYGPPDRTRYEWIPTGHGYGQKVGEIDGRPIWISLLTNTVNGYKLLFWHATSPAVDYHQCEEWLKANLPTTAFRKDGCINRAEPMNFTNVFPRRS